MKWIFSREICDFLLLDSSHNLERSICKNRLEFTWPRRCWNENPSVKSARFRESRTRKTAEFAHNNDHEHPVTSFPLWREIGKNAKARTMQQQVNNEHSFQCIRLCLPSSYSDSLRRIVCGEEVNGRDSFLLFFVVVVVLT